jgi:F420 biosynthesis protein FbiB-like protein
LSYPCLEQRRTVRRYLDQEVEAEKLDRIARAAALAPSAHHTTPWHLTIITDPAAIRRLAETMAAAWDRDMRAEGVAEAERVRRTNRSVGRLIAPAVILASMDTRSVTLGATSHHTRCEETMMIQSVAAAVYALLLATAYEGLGASWHCPPLFCQADVRDSLALPAYLAPQAMITIGYPADLPGPRPIRSVDSAITWVR